MSLLTECRQLAYCFMLHGARLILGPANLTNTRHILCLCRCSCGGHSSSIAPLSVCLSICIVLHVCVCAQMDMIATCVGCEHAQHVLFVIQAKERVCNGTSGYQQRMCDPPTFTSFCITQRLNTLAFFLAWSFSLWTKTIVKPLSFSQLTKFKLNFR